MKLKDLLVPVSFALLGTWLIQYIFFPNTPDTRTDLVSDRSFIAPSSVQAAEPLDFMVDFYDAPPTRPEHITTVTMPYGSIEFSNDGGIIHRITYKRMLGGKESLIQTVVPPLAKDRGAFLVALNGLGSTPYYYELQENKTEGDISYVTYRAESEKACIAKQFVLYHTSYRIDLRLTIEPKGGTKGESKDTSGDVRARLFFPAPFIPTGNDTDTISAVFYTEKKAIEKKPLNQLNLFGKENPSLFGLEDHYFINVLIQDPERFARRAYFRVEGLNQAEAILQSPLIKEKTLWQLSFYCGPKESHSLAQVDQRLEGVLDYGWFAPISRLLLYVLNFFYGIFENYGLAIIAVTLLLRVLMVPFTLKSDQSRRKHVEAQRKLKYIEQRYKHDPEALAREKADFARKHGIAGALGCLTLLVQIPVFIGLQRVLANAIELYKAPFFWIPDLSLKDPYYILPVFIGIGMALHTTQTGDPRQRVANILIAIIIAAVTSSLSAGLSLYICASTLLGVAQAYIQKAFKI
jgi:YidC/Oxa1 family membrane protein insertase